MKRIRAVFITLITVIMLCGCEAVSDTAISGSSPNAKDKGISSIHLASANCSVEISEGDVLKDKYFTVNSSGAFTLSDISVENENPNVAAAELVEIKLESFVYYKITAKSEGTAKLHFKSGNGLAESETINVTVTKKQDMSSTEAKASSSEIKTSASAGSKQSKSSNITSSKSKSTVSTKSKSNNTARTGNTVYVTPKGKKYHYLESCGGKNSTATSLEQAKAQGKEPCKKCAQ